MVVEVVVVVVVVGVVVMVDGGIVLVSCDGAISRSSGLSAQMIDAL